MRRILPLLFLILLFAAALWLSHGIGWDTLARHQEELLAWVRSHPLLAAGAYVLAYVLTAGLSLPHGALLTAVGGLLFGAVVATALTVVGATAGASILLVLLRNLLGGTLERQRARIPDAMRQRLARDGFSYLLAVRFLPLFPFWLVNLAAAVVGMRLAVFAPATLIGCIPVTFVVSSIGSGIGDLLAQGHTPDFSVLFAPRFLLPLLALAALSLAPTLLRRRTAHA